MENKIWLDTITKIPNYHILQTMEWGTVKKEISGWEIENKTWSKDEKIIGAALIMSKRIRIPITGMEFKMLYIPRGPIVDWQNQEHVKIVLDSLQEMTRNSNTLFVKIDPEAVIEIGKKEEEFSDGSGKELLNTLKTRKWKYSDNQIQFQNSIWLDISGEEEQILKEFKQKTRYNIRLAGRKGVKVFEGSKKDLPGLYEMYAETAQRDGFIIRSREYYLNLWETFIDNNMAVPLLAEVEGTLCSAMMLFYCGQKSWYLFGMSNQDYRNYMPSYLIQWEAIKKAKEKGCTQYDFWGAPDVFDESDSMWGVYRFKRGFDGNIVKLIGAWDFTSKPLLYSLYTKALPLVLKLMHRNYYRNMEDN